MEREKEKEPPIDIDKIKGENFNEMRRYAILSQVAYDVYNKDKSVAQDTMKDYLPRHDLDEIYTDKDSAVITKDRQDGKKDVIISYRGTQDLRDVADWEETISLPDAIPPRVPNADTPIAAPTGVAPNATAPAPNPNPNADVPANVIALFNISSINGTLLYCTILSFLLVNIGDIILETGSSGWRYNIDAFSGVFSTSCNPLGAALKINDFTLLFLPT